MIGNMSSPVRDLVFLLLGTNPTLPYSECASIMEANKIQFKEVGRLDQVLIVSAPIEACRVVARQAGMVRRGCILISKSNKNPRVILKTIAGLDLNEIPASGSSFAVRVKGVRDHSKGIDTSALERDIGAQIKAKLKWATVSLENPDFLFYTIITGNEALFCLSIERVEESGFSKRKPSSRPFFHPSSMHPRLARTMVNLSGAKPGCRFLDPFCGSGGLLAEAGIIGCKTVGADIDPRMCRGARENLSALGLWSADICTADARQVPFREIDAIAADPPYGRSSSTRGRATAALVGESLLQATAVLGSRKKVCVSVPSSLSIEKFERRNLKLIEVHQFRVHRSLTRNIVVFARR